ncbi:MAG: hypothetical protein ACRED8_03810, partial [Caulobacteraceae bacterium]
NSGVGVSLNYVLNGVSTPYSGAFSLSNGDTLGFTVTNDTGITRSGTVTVKAADGTVTVGSFAYVLKGGTG